MFSTAFFLVLTIFVPYAVRHLGLTASGIGLTLGFYGAGMVVGALLATAILRRLPFGIVVGIGPIAGLAASLLMALTIWVPTPWLAALSLFVFGAGPILWVISTTTLRSGGDASAAARTRFGRQRPDPGSATARRGFGGAHRRNFRRRSLPARGGAGLCRASRHHLDLASLDLLRQPAMDELAVAMRT